MAKSDIDSCVNAVLGNHDYRGNVEAQLSKVLTQKDWRWFCRRSFVLSSGRF